MRRGGRGDWRLGFNVGTKKESGLQFLKVPDVGPLCEFGSPGNQWRNMLHLLLGAYWACQIGAQ
jgi:hypothetical protein